MSLKVVCLQEHPELMDKCVELLNSQWPRSKTARLRSLQQGSKDAFPTSLVLLEIKGDVVNANAVVIGHCKISPVPYKRDVCFVESVVISSNRRGKGLGRHIMEQTESYVKSKGVRTIYLTTYDQQIFYEHLGYTFCDPIQLYGGGSQALIKFIEDRNELECECTMDNSRTHQAIPRSAISEPQLLKTTNKHEIKMCAPPPPPPPPPPNNTASTNGLPVIINGPASNLKFTMKKNLG